VRRLACEAVLDSKAICGEGPVWLEDRSRLAWVDLAAGSLHLFDPNTGQSARIAQVDGSLGAAVPREGGGWLLAVEDGFAEFDDAAATVAPVATPLAGHPHVRMNDGGCDPAGRFWAGSTSVDLRGAAGSLFRLDAEGVCTEMLTGIGVANGIDWNSSATTMYFVDSLAGGIDTFRFDVGEGAIRGRRRFVDIDPDDGVPDGLTVDADDCIWVALFGGGVVRRYTPDGDLDAEVGVPASQVTSCAFGGDDLDQLFITSARGDLDAEQLASQPLAGALFSVRPGVSGKAASAYAGRQRLREGEGIR
jgi:sugar lactone lactonase YvrE